VVFSVIALAAISPRSAQADSSSVTVLGVRSLDGEDQLERRVSHALRVSAKSIESYRVSDREVSLAQMSLAHGCEDVDTPCLVEIASTLSADRLLYGNLVRAGDKVRITLFNFNADTRQIESSAERTVSAAQLSDAAIGPVMLALVQRLAGKGGAATGTLRVTGNRPGAEVAVDGKPAGQLNKQGELMIAQISEGPHAVSVVTSDGRDRRELSVDVRADTTTTLRALLTPALPEVSEQPASDEPPRDAHKDEHRRRVRRIVGWSSVGVAAGFAAATIFSWVRLLKISNDSTLDAYSMLYAKPGQPGGTSDACREAENGHFAQMPGSDESVLALESDAKDLCSQADKLEKLQYVFLGSTLAFAGIGTWLLVSSRAKHGSAATASFTRPQSVSVTPGFAPHQATLQAALRF
jgi:hypothetical protein